MAVSNKAVFELRPATGNDLNSGGFVITAGGTDYSQQTSPQVTFNGTTVTAATTGATAILVITGYVVATTDVGNLVRIASGTNFIAGLYQIVSINVGAVTWTLDRVCATGVGAAMVGRMGGALATLAQFFTDVAANTNPGGYICYWTGTLTVTVATVFNSNCTTNVSGGSTSTTLAGVQVIGYNATRGDNGQATMTTATNSVDLLHLGNNARNITFYNIKFTTTAGTVGYGATPTGASDQPSRIAFDNCSWNGFKRAIWSDGPANGGAISGLYLRNCNWTACTTDGVVNNSTTVFIDCYGYTNTGDGIRMEASFVASRGVVCIRTVLYNNTGKGFNNQAQGNSRDTDQSNVLINVASVSNGSDGFLFNVAGNNGVPDILMENCIAYGNGGFGINGNVIVGMYFGGYNFFGANSSGAYGGSVAALTGDVGLSGDPFNGRTTNDFSLNNTAGAGASVRGAGFPGILQLGGTGAIDGGPLQSSGGGGGTTVIAFGPNITRIIEGEE